MAKTKTTTPKTSPSILVVGDLTIQWHCFEAAFGATGGPALAESQKKFGASGIIAGAGLFTRQLDLIGSVKISSCVDNIKSVAKEFGIDNCSLNELESKQLLAGRTSILRRQDKTENGSPTSKWRSEEVLGWVPAGDDYMEFIAKCHANLNWQDCDAVLACDHGWGYLQNYFSERPQSLRSFISTSALTNDKWIVVKSRLYPPFKFKLREGSPTISNESRADNARKWNVRFNFDPKLIVVVDISDLRAVGTRVSEGISWERTLQDLWNAAKDNFKQASAIPGIREARFVCVAFGGDAIALLDCLDIDKPVILLAFHPGSIEGDFYRENGRPYANSAWIATFLTYALATQETHAFENEPTPFTSSKAFWEHTLQIALCYMRRNSKFGVIFEPPKRGMPNRDLIHTNFGCESGQVVSWPDKWILKTGNVSETSHFDQVQEPIERAISRRRWRSLTASQFFCSQDVRCQILDLSEIQFDQRKRISTQILEEDYLAARGTDRYSQTWWTLQSYLIANRVRNEHVSGPEAIFKQYLEYAYDVLRYGGPDRDEFFPDSLLCPYAKFGDFVTSDRGEIEAFRNVRVIIEEYLANPKQYKRRPLNLAVFGPPGSGKSFGIKQLLTSLGGAERFRFHVFNLSQFTSTDALVSCFHAIQDDVLIGKIPVVFWDEFDATLNLVPFGWLQAFLAPMQDGHFIHGNRENPLNNCIFVFAGGRFARFGDLPDPNEAVEVPRQEVITMSRSEATEYGRVRDGSTSEYDLDRMERRNLLRRQEHWRVAKGNDFRSRLKGVIDIREPNAERVAVGEAYLSFDPGHPLACDQLGFLVRRARLVRSILLDLHPQLFTLNRSRGCRMALTPKGSRGSLLDSNGNSIEERSYKELNISFEVAMGFLSPYKFKHGSRSIENVISMSSLHGRPRFDLVTLAPEEDLAIHVDPRAFELGSKSDDHATVLERWISVFKMSVRPGGAILSEVVVIDLRMTDLFGDRSGDINGRVCALWWSWRSRGTERRQSGQFDDSAEVDQVNSAAYADSERVEGLEILMARYSDEHPERSDDIWEYEAVARFATNSSVRNLDGSELCQVSVIAPSVNQVAQICLGASRMSLPFDQLATELGSAGLVFLKMKGRLYGGGTVGRNVVDLGIIGFNVEAGVVEGFYPVSN